MISIAEILLDAHSDSAHKRKKSLDLLNQMIENDPGSLFASISGLLNSSEPSELRNCSGIYIKSSISPKWNKIPENLKQLIKNNCLSSLANQDTIKSSSSAISTLACLEAPENRWPELFEILIQNCHNSNLHYKLASLTALKYICQDMKIESFPSNLKNEVLTAIVANLNSKTPELVLHCLEIFIYALQFFEENFQLKHEREVIFQALFECFPVIPMKCIQAICEIMNLFPESLQDALENIIFITLAGIQNFGPDIRMLAVEVWTTAADIDENRLSLGMQPLRYLNRVCSKLSEILLPVFFNEDIFAEEWNIAKSAYNFFSGCSLLCPEENFSKISVFLKENLHLRAREAQIMAGLTVLCCTAENPSNQIYSSFAHYFDVCLDVVETHSEKPKRLGLICLDKLLVNSAFKITPNQLNRSINLLKTLIFHQSTDLKESFNALKSLLASHGSSFNMSEYLSLIQSLISFIPHKPVQQKTKGLETLSALVSILADLPEQYSQVCSKVFPDFSKLYEQSIVSNHSGYIEKLSQIMNLIICRLKPNTLSLNETSKLFNLAMSAIKQSLIIEESFAVIGSIALHSGKNFENDYKNISPVVLHHLSLTDFHETISASLILTSDLACSLKSRFVESFHLYLPALYEVLENDSLKVGHKVQAISCLGDIAENVQAAIVVHLEKIFYYVDTAAGISLNFNFERDSGESLASLREVVLQFYLSLFTGLSASKQVAVINERIPKLSQYVLMVVDEKFRPNHDIHRYAVWIICDILKIWGKAYCNIEGFLNYLKTIANGCNEIAEDARVVIGIVNLSS